MWQLGIELDDVPELVLTVHCGGEWLAALRTIRVLAAADDDADDGYIISTINGYIPLNILSYLILV